jgi:hypothetical protein
MNYALKTLMNQSDLITQEINKVQLQYDNADLESQMDVELFETDLFNLKKQQKDLVHAIELLNYKSRHK